MSTGSRETRRAFLKVVGGTAVGATLPGIATSEEIPRNEVITAITFIHGLPSREADLKAHLVSLAAPTRAEAGCVNYGVEASDRVIGPSLPV